jgi:hypothetical protein
MNNTFENYDDDDDENGAEDEVDSDESSVPLNELLGISSFVSQPINNKSEVINSTSSDNSLQKFNTIPLSVSRKPTQVLAPPSTTSPFHEIISSPSPSSFPSSKSSNTSASLSSLTDPSNSSISSSSSLSSSSSTTFPQINITSDNVSVNINQKFKRKRDFTDIKEDDLIEVKQDDLTKKKDGEEFIIQNTIPPSSVYFFFFIFFTFTILPSV